MQADDPFYRYKMPQMQVQTIGKGKMIRTAFCNVDDVAKSLHVPPACTKQFAFPEPRKFTEGSGQMSQTTLPMRLERNRSMTASGLIANERPFLANTPPQSSVV